MWCPLKITNNIPLLEYLVIHQHLQHKVSIIYNNYTNNAVDDNMICITQQSATLSCTVCTLYCAVQCEAKIHQFVLR